MRYPNRYLERIINALNEKYGNPISDRFKIWKYKGVDIIIYDLNITQEILVSYELAIGVGREYRELVTTGGSSIDDSTHF